MSTPTPTPTRTPFYVCIEVNVPDGNSTGTGSIIAVPIARPDHILSIDFNESLSSIEGALERLLTWVYTGVDQAVYEVEFVVWNKDDFARLMHSSKWLSLNSLCFISYYAALVNLPAQAARFKLNPLNLPGSEILRVTDMARMFSQLLSISATIRQLWDTFSTAPQGFLSPQD